MAIKDSGQRLAVLGDLHYEIPQDARYRAARGQLLAQRPDVVFQLGDQGGYSHCGTWRSFMEGLEFLSGFDRPFHTLLGNHDLEGPDYASDAQAVAAWCEAFSQERPYHTVELGDALAICLSSTRFRANIGCCHEVYLDELQISWLRTTLAQNRTRPTFVFSHAPIIGSGLRVLQSIHLKCPNAWMNHTDRPGRFIKLVEDHPQIKLWFSAHNHLGQHYANSVSRVSQCTFVHVGVTGEVTRDGRNHSRLVDFDRHGFTLSTVDHADGEATANLRHDYASGCSELLSPHDGEDGETHFAPPPFPAEPQRMQIGRSVFVVHRRMLVEFDAVLRAPLGVVVDGLVEDRVEVCDGELRITDNRGAVQILRPNADGRFSQIFEPNPRREQRLSA